MKIKKMLSFLMILSLILTMATGCGNKDEKTVKESTNEELKTNETGENSETSEIDSEQYINYNLGAEPSTLDASKGSDSYSNSVLINVLEPLTRFEEDEEQNNILKPAGAESWEINEEGTVWTFKIRDSKWSDGQPVKAQDYEYGIKRSVDQNIASPYAYLLSPIKNANKVNTGEAPLEELGVKSLDDNTLEITLESPTPYFEHLTYQRVMLPQRQDIVEQHGDRYGSEVETVVYNGPFSIESWVHNSEIVLVKNENYWDKDSVKLEKVNLKMIQDENASYNSLASGELDMAVANKPEWKEKFMQDENLDHTESTRSQTFFMYFNGQDEVFKNVNIRKAFSAAVDREDIVNVIFHGVNTPAYGWIPPNVTLGDDEYRSIAEEPVKKLVEEITDPKGLLIKGLEELGMDPDPSKLTVKISLGSTDQWFRTYGEYLQQMYSKKLGVNFEVEQMEWPVFNSNVEKGEFQIGYQAWGAEYSDPITMMSLLKSDAAAIKTGWKNERYDELIELVSKEMDPAKRLEYFKEAEEILLYEDSVLAPVTYPRANVFKYKYLKGMGVTPFETQGFKYVYTQGR